MGATCRRGSFLAVAVIVVFLILILLGAVLVSAGGDYNLHAMNLFGTRATLYARAALSEAGLGLSRKLRTAAGRDSLAGGSWSQFLQQLQQQLPLADSPATGPLLELSIADLAPRAAQMATAGGARLSSVTLSMRAFRRIATSAPEADVTNPDSFYKDSYFDAADSPDVAPPADWVGLAVLTARVDFEGPRVYTHRQLSAQHVVKVSAAGPPARQFVLFSWGDAAIDTPEGPMAEDLNKGGSLLLFGRRDGRIHLRGVYAVETAGYPYPFHCEDPVTAPAGGEKPNPVAAPGYLPIEIAPDLKPVDYQWVDSWGTGPAPRAGVVEICGPMLLRSIFSPAYPQIRPNHWAVMGMPPCPVPIQNLGDLVAAGATALGFLFGMGIDILACLVDGTLPLDILNNCWTLMFVGDPGLLIQNAQWWFVETQHMDKTELASGEPKVPNYFSLTGATVPDSQGRVRVSPFKGILARDRPQSDKLFERLGPYAPAEPKPGRLARPSELAEEDGKQYCIQTEGLSTLVHHRVTKCQGWFCDVFYTLGVDMVGKTDACGTVAYPEDRTQLQPVTLPLGLYWAPIELADRYAAALGDFLGLATTVLTMGIGARFGSGKMWVRVLESMVVGQMLNSLGQAVAQNYLASLNGAGGSGGSATAIVPPAFRLPARTALRRYARLTDYPGLYTHAKDPDLAEPDHDLLVLDGPIFVEDLAHDKPIRYTGRGAILTDDTDGPYLTAPIVAADQAELEFTVDPSGARRSDVLGVLGPDTPQDYDVPGADSDALAIFVRGKDDERWSQGAMLELRTADSFETTFGYETPAPVHAWIYSAGGARPDGPGKAARIVGNLVCAYPNRRHIPPGSKLEVMYRPPPPASSLGAAGLSGAWSAYAGESR